MERPGLLLSASVLALAALAASCALTFPDYPVGSGGSGGGSSTSTAGAPNGSVCGVDADCASAHCVPSNAGSSSVCCANDCADAGATSCGTNGKCDPGGAGCALYPAKTACGATSCEAGMLTAEVCQSGRCGAGEPSPCAGGLACANAAACKTTCATNADCAAPTAVCPTPGSTFCVEPDGAPCASHGECLSGVCGTTGVGHCCTAECPIAGGPCGATDCDGMGACVLPDANTPCGAASACMNDKLTSEHCDGMGACASGTTEKPCAQHLGCADATTCNTTCGSNDASGDERCAAGYWCDGSTCLPASWQGGAACTRNGQCCSGDCTPIGCYLWTPCN